MKRRYQKPQIKKVKLVPEEAVLKVCKPVNGSDLGKCNCNTNVVTGS